MSWFITTNTILVVSLDMPKKLQDNKLIWHLTFGALQNIEDTRLNLYVGTITAEKVGSIG